MLVDDRGCRWQSREILGFLLGISVEREARIDVMIQLS